MPTQFDSWESVQKFLKSGDFQLTLHAVEELGFLARVTRGKKAVQVLDPVLSRAIDRVCDAAERKLKASASK